MSEVTEIIEELSTQLEIIETDTGQIEVVGEDKNIIEISFSSSIFNENSLDLTTQTNIVTIESPSETTQIDITDEITNVDVTSTTTAVEIVERSLLSGSFDLTFPNLINNPFRHTGGTDRIGTIGVIDPDFNFQVSGSFFSDTVNSTTVNSSKNIIQGNGTDDLLLIKVGNDDTPKVRINPQGVAILDNYTYTPTPHEGGLLFSGSEFYLGLK